jgi:hypothetical protein
MDGAISGLGLFGVRGVRAGLGPPLHVGGSRVVCRFGLFLIDKIASQKSSESDESTGRMGPVPKSFIDP